jgi:hypothetical protein
LARYTKQLARFLSDADAAGYTFRQSEDAAGLIILGRVVDSAFKGVAEIRLWSKDGVERFYKGEPIGGALTLDDFWTLKGMRERFGIRTQSVATPATSGPPPEVDVAFPGNRPYAVKVVGESFYESNLRSICGLATDTMRQFAKIAVLIPEDDNPYDPNAVRVDIDGLQVGHLSRDDALRFRRGSPASNARPISCDAVVIALRGSARSDYGVRLDLRI